MFMLLAFKFRFLARIPPSTPPPPAALLYIAAAPPQPDILHTAVSYHSPDFL